MKAGRVQVIRRDDGHGLDAVRPGRLRLRHGAVVAVAALWRQVQRGAAVAGALRIGRQGTRHQFVLVIDARRDAVHGTDERALPAPYHAQP